jgi:hypothetical protein
MSTSRADISRWFDEGVNQGASRLIVVCDTFEYEDYPLYVKTDAEFDTKFAQYNGINMQIVMEVYDLNADKAEQMVELRTFRFPSTKSSK